MNIYERQEGFKNWFQRNLGSLAGLLGMVAAFFVSTLDNTDGQFNFKEQVTSLKFWITWAVVFGIVLIVSNTNYELTKKQAKEEDKFMSTMKYYGETKKETMKHIDLLPAFAEDKNRQIYKTLEREIVESADLIYDRYKNGEYTDLEEWQLKRLDEIKKIKIKKLRSTDLTQETLISSKKVYSFLPEGESEVTKKRNKGLAVKRAINTFAFLMIGGLTVSLIGWVAGITNAFGVASAWFMSIISARDYVENGLRQRMIAKADLLSEFNETWEKYVPKQPKEVIKEEHVPHLQAIHDLIQA